MTISTAFGKVIKKWRQSRKISQAELAQRCNLDRSFISLLETGKKQPTLKTIFLISQVLKVKPDELVQQTYRLSKLTGTRRAPLARVRRL